MDPLSDLFRVVRLNGAYFYPVEAFPPWQVEAPPAATVVPKVLPEAEHLISYHILTSGQAWAGLRDEPLVELKAGDVIVFPHGDPHSLASGPVRQAGVEIYTGPVARYPECLTLGIRSGTPTRFFCGFLGCDRWPFNPLLAALPRRLVVPAGWVGGFASQIVEESTANRPGSDTILARLAELMFMEVVRRYVETLRGDQTGWLAGLRDPVVGRVLTLIHSAPSRQWTLAELGKEANASRTVVAERFAELVGQPPMQYLTQWRMQVAADLLVRSHYKVAAVADEVGYESEAAFSRAFKRATGYSPGAWRARPAPPSAARTPR